MVAIKLVKLFTPFHSPHHDYENGFFLFIYIFWLSGVRILRIGSL